MNIALILSGGIGSRMEADIPKQYIKVDGRKIIDYCLETFEKCEGIDAIQIVADNDWQGAIEEMPLRKLHGFSRPGKTRQLSILKGLEDIRAYAKDEDIVIIHDAARPLVTGRMVEEMIGVAQQHDGVMPVLPMKDTVYYSEDGRVVSSLLERKCIYAGQSPEGFVFGKYYQANKALTFEEMLKINGSTEPAIMAGLDIALIPGDEQNFKITTKEDLHRFGEVITNR